MVVEPARRLFTVAEYNRMGEVGIIGPEDRVELLDGEIVEMSPIGSRHISVVAKLHHILTIALQNRAFVPSQSPTILDDFSEPEPDLYVARYRDDWYATAIARPHDLLLVIEVAESSLSFDLNRKVPRYALADIPEAWVIDLTTDRIEVFRSPSADDYTEHLTLERGDVLAPQAFEDLALDVTQILG